MTMLTIAQAKTRLSECVRIYLQKDAAGRYLLPQNKQRPIYLEGPAGVGKTEVVRQVAEEAGIGFVSYSMTHHNRQSAIGLPAIVERTVAGHTFQATEYTMSEIVGAIWQAVEEGHREGIFFADEINCVPETLHAAMLQFLQAKTFGPHRIPEGWLIVAAGNPTEYNRSARDFDPVTRDRMRTIRIEPNCKAWLDYAVTKGMHGAVVQYVTDHQAEFYVFGGEKNKRQLVTARGWEDLGSAIELYERGGLPVDKELVEEFLQSEKVAAGFYTYYRVVSTLLTQKQMQSILDGRIDKATAKRMQSFSFQERWSVLVYLLTQLERHISQVLEQIHAQDQRYAALKAEGAGVKEQARFQKEAEQLDKNLDRARSQINNVLDTIGQVFGQEREADILIARLLQSRRMQEFSEFRRMDRLIEMYTSLSQRRSQTVKEIEAWAAQAKEA